MQEAGKLMRHPVTTWSDGRHAGTVLACISPAALTFCVASRTREVADVNLSRLEGRAMSGRDQSAGSGAQCRIDGAGLVKLGLPDGSSVLLTWQAAESLRAHLASAVSAILRGESA